MFAGPNRIPAGGEERPGKSEEGSCQEDQNAGICLEAGEVGVSYHLLPLQLGYCASLNTTSPILPSSVQFIYCYLLVITNAHEEMVKLTNEFYWASLMSPRRDADETRKKAAYP